MIKFVLMLISILFLIICCNNNQQTNHKILNHNNDIIKNNKVSISIVGPYSLDKLNNAGFDINEKFIFYNDGIFLVSLNNNSKDNIYVETDDSFFYDPTRVYELRNNIWGFSTATSIYSHYNVIEFKPNDNYLFYTGWDFENNVDSVIFVFGYYEKLDNLMFTDPEFIKVKYAVKNGMLFYY